MSEVKRVALTTISTTTSNSGSIATTNGPAAKEKEDGSRMMSSLFGGAEMAPPPDKKTKKKLTMRFELELFSPTDDKFPEFNYVHLVQMEKVGLFVSAFVPFTFSVSVQMLLLRDTDALNLVFCLLALHMHLFVRLSCDPSFVVNPRSMKIDILFNQFPTTSRED